MKNNKGSSAPQHATTKKVFDVMRPGRNPVSSTSRPVIVGHKPQVKDPMMSDKEDRPLMDSAQKVTVQPGADATAPEPVSAPPAPAPDATAPLPEPSMPTDTASVSPQPKPPTPPQPADDVTKSDDAAASSVASVVTSSAVDMPTEDAVKPAEPTAPAAPETPAPSSTGSNATSGLVFDDGDGNTSSTPQADEPLTTPQPVPDNAPKPSQADDVAPKMPPADKDENGKESEVSEQVAGQAVVSHHNQKSGMLIVVISLLVLVVVAVIVLDILLDSGILTISNVPHTNFFAPQQ